MTRKHYILTHGPMAGRWKHARLRPVRILGFWVLSLLGVGCMKGPSFMKQENAPKAATTLLEETQAVIVAVREEDGGVVGSFDATSDKTQIMQAASGSEIAGAAVAFPPGSLAISAEVALKPGVALSSETLLQTLDLQDGLEAAAPAVAIAANVKMDAVAPFTISLPLPLSAGLMLDDPYAKLIVLYQVEKHDEGESYQGFYTRDQLIISDGTVKVTTRHFGVFQAVISKTLVAVAKVKSSTEIKAEAASIAKLVYFHGGFGAVSFGDDKPSAAGLRTWVPTLRSSRVIGGGTVLSSGITGRSLQLGSE